MSSATSRVYSMLYRSAGGPEREAFISKRPGLAGERVSEPSACPARRDGKGHARGPGSRPAGAWRRRWLRPGKLGRSKT
jgi:hypothetical protein